MANCYELRWMGTLGRTEAMGVEAGIILYHAAPSRSSGVVQLLRELDALYELRLIDLKTSEQLTPEFRAVNPMGRCR